jgi:diguanylate cyclase (GGDEF)-like protein
MRQSDQTSGSFTDRLHDLFNDFHFGVFVLDSKQHIQYINHALLNITQLEEHQLMNQSLQSFIERTTWMSDHNIKRLLNSGDPLEALSDFEWLFRINHSAREGHELLLKCKRHWANTPHSTDICMVFDVSMIHQLEQQLINAQRHDPLTRLMFRSVFLDQVSQHISAGISCFSLLLVDITQMKHINAVLGFSGGDQVIQWISYVLRKTIKSTDLVCRYNGGQFMLFLHGVSRTMAEGKANSLTQFIKQNKPDMLFTDVAIKTSVVEYTTGDELGYLVKEVEKSLNR